ncbi:MAG TPA: phospholipase D-like domain-containing protein [Candidatus Brocadiaceae bacterium]|nr:phospholipase D-like domain-containing protein [Candidatus Brocadiaceae bacterium]
MKVQQIISIKIKVFIIVLIVFCAFHTPSSFGLPADDVIPLVDGDYYPQVHQALITASKSISCVMYMADINPKYNKGWEYNLVNDLIGAHRRGVDVSVIFDQNTMFWESGKNGKKTERRSQEAYELLKKNGVPVYYDSKDRVTHSKILVIDGYITILGSTNWTYSALRKNREASVLIKSRSVAESFLNKLRTISKYQPK